MSCYTSNEISKKIISNQFQGKFVKQIDDEEYYSINVNSVLRIKKDKFDKYVV